MAGAADAGLITGYRRVLHAELSARGLLRPVRGGLHGGLPGDHLMPMHPGCHCVPVPVSPRWTWAG
jgi:hypothetical protein